MRPLEKFAEALVRMAPAPEAAASRPMPDSAVERTPDPLAGDTAAQDGRTGPDMPAAPDNADPEKKFARAARSAQRLAQLSERPRNGETLDLFAEDAERAHFQALNTDIRQGTFEGFELPEVFLAAVQTNCGAPPAEPTVARRASKESVTSVEPAPGLFQDEALQPPADESGAVAKPGALAAAVARAASISCVALQGRATRLPPQDTAQAPHSVTGEAQPQLQLSAPQEAVLDAPPDSIAQSPWGSPTPSKRSMGSSPDSARWRRRMCVA
jgi:hypothetical protein